VKYSTLILSLLYICISIGLLSILFSINFFYIKYSFIYIAAFLLVYLYFFIFLDIYTFFINIFIFIVSLYYFLFYSYEYLHINKGERRIRVCTLCLPVAKTIGDLFRFADSDSMICFLAKIGILVFH
jgi:hypothetical protein